MVGVVRVLVVLVVLMRLVVLVLVGVRLMGRMGGG